MNDRWREANAKAQALARRIHERQAAGEEIPADDAELVEYTAAAHARQAEVAKGESEDR